jgi:hypothetical protein
MGEITQTSSVQPPQEFSIIALEKKVLNSFWMVPEAIFLITIPVSSRKIVLG